MVERLWSQGYFLALAIRYSSLKGFHVSPLRSAAHLAVVASQEYDLVRCPGVPDPHLHSKYGFTCRVEDSPRPRSVPELSESDILSAVHLSRQQWPGMSGSLSFNFQV